jgi:hypothetical protein
MLIAITPIFHFLYFIPFTPPPKDQYKRDMLLNNKTLMSDQLDQASPFSINFGKRS